MEARGCAATCRHVYASPSGSAMPGPRVNQYPKRGREQGGSDVIDDRDSRRNVGT